MGTPSADVTLQVEPPGGDRLGVLTGTSVVVREARHVRLNAHAIEGIATRWAGVEWPEQAGLDALHFNDGTERTVNWVLLLDALNFCFWGEPGHPRWRVEWAGQILDGYYALAAALNRAMEEGRPLWDAGYLAELSAHEMETILRPAPGCPRIPLFDARLANAREVGRVLETRYAGEFANACSAAAGSAVDLALLLARDFPSFTDVSQWGNHSVPFLKRAQICVADLHASFGGQGWGAFRDLDALTAFADYKLPQLLRHLGALAYSPELAQTVDSLSPISSGSTVEIEIRAATVWAVEILHRALARHGVDRTASAIDYRLWAESQTALADDRPYHRTRTIYY